MLGVVDTRCNMAYNELEVSGCERVLKQEHHHAGGFFSAICAIAVARYAAGLGMNLLSGRWILAPSWDSPPALVTKITKT